MDISIFGLGYVGTVCAGTLASEGHRVIGVDVNPMKVKEVNSGVPPIVEPGLTELFQRVHAAGSLRATASAVEAVGSTSISLICVGTPSQPNGDLDLGYTERVCTEIGEAIRSKPEPHVSGVSQHDASGLHRETAGAHPGKGLRATSREGPGGVLQPGVPPGRILPRGFLPSSQDRGRVKALPAPAIRFSPSMKVSRRPWCEPPSRSPKW